MKTAADPLVLRAVQGDRDALSELLDQVGQEVARELRPQIARRWRGVLDVEDVMQVTYLEAFLQVGSLLAASRAAFARWLMQIAMNNLRDAIRGLETDKRPPIRRRLEPLSPGDSHLKLLERVSTPGSTPSRCAARGEMKAMLEEAIRRLPDDYAKILRLMDLEMLPVDEIIARMRRSRGSVYMLRARALGHLRDLLGSDSKFFSDVP